jgi:glyoxylase-like metal-dependent hydrolase (beta-lactamase superfamily II)
MSAKPPLPVADDWFFIEPADEFGVRRIRETYVHEYGGGSIWLVEGEKRALLVDTGVGVAPLRQFVETVTTKPVLAFASLGYYDHAGGLHQFDERLIHAADAHRVRHPDRHNTAADRYMGGAFDALPFEGFDPHSWVMPGTTPTRLLADGDVLDLGGRVFEVQHLPGVTDGACALFEHATGVLFTGETLVWDGDFVYDGEPAEVCDDADRAAFRKSMARLTALPARAVYPPHFGRGDVADMRRAIAGYLAGRNAAHGANTYHV